MLSNLKHPTGCLLVKLYAYSYLIKKPEINVKFYEKFI